MNHLKYILGVNVPRRVSSNARIKHRSHGHQYETWSKRRLSKSRLTRVDRVSSAPMKRKYQSLQIETSRDGDVIFELRKARIDKGRITQDDDIRSKATLLVIQRNTASRRGLGSRAIQTAQFSTTSKYHGRESVDDEYKRTIKNWEEENEELSTNRERKNRSYAQLIAEYSDAMCPASNANFLIEKTKRKGSVGGGPAVSKLVCRTSSTLSTCADDTRISKNMPIKKIIEDSPSMRNSHIDMIDGPNAKNTKDRWQGPNVKSNHEIRSYAKMIADYSTDVTANASMVGELVSTLPVSEKNAEKIEAASSSVPTMNLTSTNSNAKVINDSANEPEKGNVSHASEVVDADGDGPASLERHVDWAKRVEGVLKDLKNASAKKKRSMTKKLLPNLGEDESLVHEAIWLENVVSAHRKNSGVLSESQDNSTNEQTMKSSSDLEVTSRNPGDANDSISTNLALSEYIHKGPSAGSTQVPTSDASATGANVELHMVPSQKESVVTVNVNNPPSAVKRNPQSAEDRELSIMVRSAKDRRKTPISPRTTEVSMTRTFQERIAPKSVAPPTDFSSMHISISEDSLPVKQLELSVNGEPVSEVRSITTRSERLDVLTSPDKVEIRVPFSGGKAGAMGAAGIPSTQGSDIIKRTNPTRSPKSVLKLRIATKFDETHSARIDDASISVQRTPSPPQTGIKPRNPKGESNFMKNTFGRVDDAKKIPPKANEKTVISQSPAIIRPSMVVGRRKESPQKHSDVKTRTKSSEININDFLNAIRARRPDLFGVINRKPNPVGSNPREKLNERQDQIKKIIEQKNESGKDSTTKVAKEAKDPKKKEEVPPKRTKAPMDNKSPAANTTESKVSTGTDTAKVQKTDSAASPKKISKPTDDILAYIKNERPDRSSGGNPSSIPNKSGGVGEGNTGDNNPATPATSSSGKKDISSSIEKAACVDQLTTSKPPESRFSSKPRYLPTESLNRTKKDEDSYKPFCLTQLCEREMTTVTNQSVEPPRLPGDIEVASEGKNLVPRDSKVGNVCGEERNSQGKSSLFLANALKPNQEQQRTGQEENSDATSISKSASENVASPSRLDSNTKKSLEAPDKSSTIVDVSEKARSSSENVIVASQPNISTEKPLEATDNSPKIVNLEKEGSASEKVALDSLSKKKTEKILEASDNVSTIVNSERGQSAKAVGSTATLTNDTEKKSDEKTLEFSEVMRPFKIDAKMAQIVSNSSTKRHLESKIETLKPYDKTVCETSQTRSKSSVASYQGGTSKAENLDAEDSSSGGQSNERKKDKTLIDYGVRVPVQEVGLRAERLKCRIKRISSDETNSQREEEAVPANTEVKVSLRKVSDAESHKRDPSVLRRAATPNVEQRVRYIVEPKATTKAKEYAEVRDKIIRTQRMIKPTKKNQFAEANRPGESDKHMNSRYAVGRRPPSRKSFASRGPRVEKVEKAIPQKIEEEPSAKDVLELSPVETVDAKLPKNSGLGSTMAKRAAESKTPEKGILEETINPPVKDDNVTIPTIADKDDIDKNSEAPVLEGTIPTLRKDSFETLSNTQQDHTVKDSSISVKPSSISEESNLGLRPSKSVELEIPSIGTFGEVSDSRAVEKATKQQSIVFGNETVRSTEMGIPFSTDKPVREAQHEELESIRDMTLPLAGTIQAPSKDSKKDTSSNTGSTMNLDLPKVFGEEPPEDTAGLVPLADTIPPKAETISMDINEGLIALNSESLKANRTKSRETSKILNPFSKKSSDGSSGSSNTPLTPSGPAGPADIATISQQSFSERASNILRFKRTSLDNLIKQENTVDNGKMEVRKISNVASDKSIPIDSTSSNFDRFEIKERRAPVERPEKDIIYSNWLQRCKNIFRKDTSYY